MSKSDKKAIATGAALGLGAFLILWHLRRTQKLPELDPVTVRWESA